MTLHNFFRKSAVYEARQAYLFQEHFDLKKALVKIPFVPGASGDYRVQPDGSSDKYEELFTNTFIEFKSDRTCLRTRHFYVEFEQTSNNWFSRKASGHQLAIDESCLLVIEGFEKFYSPNEHQPSWGSQHFSDSWNWAGFMNPSEIPC